VKMLAIVRNLSKNHTFRTIANVFGQRIASASLWHDMQLLSCCTMLVMSTVVETSERYFAALRCAVEGFARKMGSVEISCGYRFAYSLNGFAEGDGKYSNSTDTACSVPTVSVTMSCLPFCFLFLLAGCSVTELFACYCGL
jgi:hypothetical protein